MKIAIFGATGGTGKELVSQALEQGHEITALVRNPQKLSFNDQRVNIIKGDVLNKDEVLKTIQGNDAVLVALGVKPPSKAKVVGPGTKNIIEAMKANNVKRLIVESAMFMDDVLRQRSFLMRLLAATLMKGLYRDKLVQEKAVMESGLDWVIARPTGLTNGAKNGWQVRNSREAGMTSRISRANVADFMLKQIKDDSYLRRTVLLSE